MRRMLPNTLHIAKFQKFRDLQIQRKPYWGSETTHQVDGSIPIHTILVPYTTKALLQYAAEKSV